MKKNGFTLIELIIVMALMALVIAVVAAIAFTGNRIFTDTDVRTDLQIEAQNVEQDISNTFMEAVSIKSIDSVDFDNESEKETVIDTWVTPNEIVLSTKTLSDDSVVVTDEYELKKQDNKILIGPKGGNLKTLTANLEDFKVKPHDDSMEVEIDLKKTKWKTNEQYPIKIKILFRNRDNV